MKKRVTIQGVEGCFHDAAAHAYFAGDDIEVVPCETFPAMFEALKADSSLLGAMAIENTIAGSLCKTTSCFAKATSLWWENTRCAFPMCSVLCPDRLLTNSRKSTHPMALRQCEQFLLRHPNLKMVEKTDTAGSAEEIARLGLKGHAAICGKYAAELYGLNILEEGIETNKRNFTRFLILADPIVEQELASTQKKDKASLVFTLPHTQGSLAKILTIFSFYDINLSKIQSIPIIGREWEYRFFINLTFDDYTRYRQSIEAVKPLITDFKILGEYSHFIQDGND